MKIAKSRPSAASATGQLDVIGPHAEVAPDRYDEIARQHVAANGGQGVVIDPRKTPRQWRAWLAYFAWLDGQAPRGRKAPTMRLLRNGATVPTEWPLGFDLNAPAAPLFDPDDTDFDRNAPLERRREIGAQLRQAVAGFAMPGRRQPPPDARYAPTPSFEAEAVAYNQARLEEAASLPPVALSAGLAAKFAPPAPSEPWGGPPPPEPPPEPAWRRSEDIYDDEVQF
jgi:hypothetical protein